MIGCWLLVVGCWLLVVGCWLLVISFFLLQNQSPFVPKFLEKTESFSSFMARERKWFGV